MPIRNLKEPAATAFGAWLDNSVERARETLEFREITRGVQALIRRRGPGSRGARVMDGAGKRAALTCYLAPLEFMAAHLATVSLFASAKPAPRRIVDLACGLGATGAGLATAFERPPPLFGVERARATLVELRHTWKAFGLEGRAVPSPPLGIARGDLLCVSWRPGSPEGDEERRLLARVAAATRRGASVLVLESAGFRDDARHARWKQALEPLGATESALRPSIDRPAFVRRMDKAVRLDHQRIVLRLLASRPAG